jgi:cell wall assembly regulator SMI1
MTPGQVLAAGFEQIETWMLDNGAPLLAQNLAPGATLDGIARTEAQLGFSIPVDLRALWSLHDGQLEEGNGFVEAFCLYSMELALAERENLLRFVENLREDADVLSEAGLTEAEVASDAWIAFAGLDSDGLAVSAVSGRVFEMRHDDSPQLVVIADSIAAWATAYAGRVAAGDYRVEDGFGDYYLQLRDRQGERLEEDRARREAEEAERRAKLPLPALLTEAISRDDERFGGDVLARARAESPNALREAIALLFQGATPAFIAGTLRLLLGDLTLSAAQWEIVAEGGRQLGNQAIRNFALARVKATRPS